ncbi:MAG: hypothetical protein JWQ32_1809 [Marmoricola sp.]|nr:hypothetical protein [Marmoricola sp.]
MRPNYDLVSLRLDTMFDDPAPVVELPAVIERANRDLLALMDGAENAPKRLLRILRPTALIGFHVDRPGEGVTVRLGLVVDERATQMWHRHISGLWPSLRQEVDESKLQTPDVSGRHRTLTISAQGVPMAVMVLGVRRDLAATQDEVTFQVPAELLSAGDLVLIGIDSSPVGGDWGLASRMVDGAVGVAVTSVTVEPGLDDSFRAHVASGRHDARGARAMAETGYFVVNPGSGDSAVTVEVTEAARGGRRAALLRRLLPTKGDIDLEVRDLAGQAVPGVRIAPGRADLPALKGPVQVRPRRAGQAAAGARRDWAVRIS